MFELFTVCRKLHKNKGLLGNIMGCYAFWGHLRLLMNAIGLLKSYLHADDLRPSGGSNRWSPGAYAAGDINLQAP